MTVADLVFYDVPGRGDLTARIYKYDSGYQAALIGSVWTARYPTLLDALIGVRKYLDLISRSHRLWQQQNRPLSQQAER